MPYPEFSYAGGRLDRAGKDRKDPGWLAAMLAHGSRRVIPLWRDRNLVIGGGGGTGEEPTPVVLGSAAARKALSLATETVLLGLDDTGPLIAVELPAEKNWLGASWLQGGEFLDLRRVGALLSNDQAAKLATARGLIYWHRQNHFCGRCGSATQSVEGGVCRVCTSGACAGRVFPRIDPAVIVLVEYHPPDGGEPLCLLGRHGKLPEGMYSTLAGFVEPGESLEEAVIREVREEAGVCVNAVRYRGSQPWPFPSSIMLGFRARATSTEVVPGDAELEEARWFSAEDVKSFGEWDDPGTGPSMPRRDSIARYLIESWALNSCS